ncbi:MAG: hypothetical protein ACHQ4H_08045 [Ktedonobacterales bacterium]
MNNAHRKTTATQATTAITEHRQPVRSMPRPEVDEQFEEAFEATILRLDGVTAERLFRRAGE